MQPLPPLHPGFVASHLPLWLASAALPILLSLLALGAVVGAAELLHARVGVAAITTRRLVHLATGLYVVVLPHLFRSVGPVLLLAAIFVVVNGITAARGWIRGMHPAGNASAGTVAFPLALMFVAPFTWTPERIFALQTAFLILAVADPVAAIVGERWPMRAGSVGAARKSVGGSAAFIVAAALLATLGVWGFGGGGREGSFTEVLMIALVVAAVAAGVEALGGRGWDNLFVPASVVLVLLLWRDHADRPGWMVAGVAVAGPVEVDAQAEQLEEPAGAPDDLQQAQLHEALDTLQCGVRLLAALARGVRHRRRSAEERRQVPQGLWVS